MPGSLKFMLRDDTICLVRAWDIILKLIALVFAASGRFLFLEKFTTMNYNMFNRIAER